MRAAVKRLVRAFGFDVVRLPAAGTMEHYLGRLLREVRPDCVVDVGARIGDYGALCRRLGFGGRIVSIEPAPSSYAALAERARRDPGWTTIHAAAGGANERRTLNVTSFSALSSFLEPSDYGAELFGERARIVGREEVELDRLDELVAPKSGRRLFLKVDTQGWDLEVLRGATGILPEVEALHIELAVRPVYRGAVTYLDALGELETLGFELAGLFNGISAGCSVVELECFLTRRP
jgi:FkbM family methyltransferase